MGSTNNRLIAASPAKRQWMHDQWQRLASIAFHDAPQERPMYPEFSQLRRLINFYLMSCDDSHKYDMEQFISNCVFVPHDNIWYPLSEIWQHFSAFEYDPSQLAIRMGDFAPDCGGIVKLRYQFDSSSREMHAPVARFLSTCTAMERVVVLRDYLNDLLFAVHALSQRDSGSTDVFSDSRPLPYLRWRNSTTYCDQPWSVPEHFLQPFFDAFEAAFNKQQLVAKRQRDIVTYWQTHWPSLARNEVFVRLMGKFISLYTDSSIPMCDVLREMDELHRHEQDQGHMPDVDFDAICDPTLLLQQIEGTVTTTTTQSTTTTATQTDVTDATATTRTETHCDDHDHSVQQVTSLPVGSRSSTASPTAASRSPSVASPEVFCRSPPASPEASSRSPPASPAASGRFSPASRKRTHADRDDDIDSEVDAVVRDVTATTQAAKRVDVEVVADQPDLFHQAELVNDAELDDDNNDINDDDDDYHYNDMLSP
jgi:hypothetical protein